MATVFLLHVLHNKCIVLSNTTDNELHQLNCIFDRNILSCFFKNVSTHKLIYEYLTQLRVGVFIIMLNTLGLL